ncbi:EAL domain-containing protein [Stutzerimonas sp. NM35]
MPDHCLLFHLHGLQALRETMGVAATEAATAKLDSALPAMLDALLQHHRIEALPQIPGLAPGQWARPFRCAAGAGLLSDDDFARSILAAANVQGAVLMRNIFGTATARLAGLEGSLLHGADATALRAGEACDAHGPEREAVCAADERCLHELLDGSGPRIFLQPLVRLRDRRLLGFEALARGPAGSGLERADRLFDTAYRCGLGHELEKACIRAALAWRKHIAADLLLSINVSEPVLAASDVQTLLARPGVLVELTEHLPLGQAAKLLPTRDRLHAKGAQVALDDTGCGFADLQAARELQPDFVKLCITIVNSLGESPALLAELRETLATLHDLGCRIIAEGVEREDTTRLLAELGIEYVQGWHFGRPAPAAEALERWSGLA